MRKTRLLPPLPIACTLSIARRIKVAARKCEESSLSYGGTVRRCLISSPGDVLPGDLSVVHRQITWWNGIYGPMFSTAITPISWGTHAAAEFGQPPQDILNKQLVDSCDMCIAIFANRLGTRTAKADSGTAEEIERLAESNRYVAVLRSTQPVDVSKTNLNQAQKLERYLAKIEGKALVLPYANEAQLAANVNNILPAAVSADHARTITQLESARYADVWPRVESEEKIFRQFRGESMTYRAWYVVLANTGTASARDVRFKTEATKEGELPWSLRDLEADEEPYVEVLAPHGEMRFEIDLPLNHTLQVRCTVTWTDDRGDYENKATLRLS
jgi:hypothetical protein